MDILNGSLVKSPHEWGILFALVFVVILALYLFDLLTIYFLITKRPAVTVKP